MDKMEKIVYARDNIKMSCINCVMMLRLGRLYSSKYHLPNIGIVTQHGFPQTIQTDARIAPSVTPQLLPSHSFTVPYHSTPYNIY
jgi:hypothetical protein